MRRTLAIEPSGRNGSGEAGKERSKKQQTITQRTFRPSTKLPTLLMLRLLNVIFSVNVRFVLGELVLPNGFAFAVESMPQSASSASIVGGSMPF